jgi:hypothetical protein
MTSGCCRRRSPQGSQGWRAARLECLMYRVLWVCEAVQQYSQQYSPHLMSRQ